MMEIYKKILEVMKDIEYLQKDDNVSTGGSGSYKAISEEKVTETVRKSLIRNGLVILPIEQEHKRDDTLLKTEKTYQGTTEVKETISRLSTVNTKYKIVDVETGEYEILASSGTGVDTQDKGVGKAMTYSYKYLFLRTFAIPTGEDPDKISSDTLDEMLSGKPQKPPQQTRPSGNSNTAPKHNEAAKNDPISHEKANKQQVSEIFKLAAEKKKEIPDFDIFKCLTDLAKDMRISSQYPYADKEKKVINWTVADVDTITKDLQLPF